MAQKRFTIQELNEKGFAVDRDSKKGIRLVGGDTESLLSKSDGPDKRRVRGARKTEVDGIMFPSKREASTFLKLKMQERAGLIKDLVVNASLPRPEKIRYQLRFDGYANEHYEPDFEYIDCETGEKVTADAKGYPTDTYKKKKRLMKRIYDIAILEL